jgi:aspartate carbamoyltransferase catalytic subunit
MAINLKSILKVADIDVFRLNKLLEMATSCEQEHYGNQVATKLWKLSRPPILATLFFEPSTRTRLSFETAMLSLGGRVINLDQNSSIHKGESEPDTVKAVSQYADVLAIRHSTPGRVEELSHFSHVPVINAGDGGNEHPTQALLDLYTIQKYKKQGQLLTIMFTGDLQYSRTVNSLVKLLFKYGKYGLNLIYTSPANDEINAFPHIQLKQSSIYFRHYLPQVDVWYLTRIQSERYSDPKDMPIPFVLSSEDVGQLKFDAIVMHPFPRNREIDPYYDTNFRMKYFEQIKNGVFVRMAILRDCLN